MPVPFDDVYLVSRKLAPSSFDEVEAAEQAIWSSFPEGYSEFVTQFGEGELTDWLIIDPPNRIRRTFRSHQANLEEYFSWDDGCRVLSKELVVESIPLGRTTNGDQLVFHPGDPNRILALPRDEETIYEIGKGLVQAIEWLFSAGTLGKPIKLKAFRPGHHWTFGFHTSNRVPSLEQVRDALLSLAVHDRVVEESDDNGDIFFKMYVQEFGGSVCMLADLDIERTPGGMSVISGALGENDFSVNGISASGIGRRPLLIVDLDEDRITPKLKVIISVLGKFGYQPSQPVPSSS